MQEFALQLLLVDESRLHAESFLNDLKFAIVTKVGIEAAKDLWPEWTSDEEDISDEITDADLDGPGTFVFKGDVPDDVEAMVAAALAGGGTFTETITGEWQ